MSGSAPRSFVLVLVLVILGALAPTGCGRAKKEQAARWTGGDPSRGEVAIRHFGCSSCHLIPGIPGADGVVGPPLDRIASRLYIAGKVPNTPANMMSFLSHPHGPDREIAMPEMGIPDREVRDIAAYLYTLK